MAYQSVVDVIRATANEVNSNATFTHGRMADVSLEFDKETIQIHLLPFDGNVDLTNNYFETYQIQMLFLKQDSPDSTVEDREEIISEMDILSRDFINALYLTDGVQMSGIRTAPNYRMLSATLSGYLVQFNLNVTTSPC